MNAAIITIGDEILIGQVIDTNSSWIGQKLSEIGINVKKIWSVSDSHDEIILGLKQALFESEIVFITGGLGPTKDDITKKAIADFLGVDLFFHQATFDKIKRMFEKLGREMSPNHNDQCLMPMGVHILNNSMGTAPGMMFIHEGKRIFSMPGVPFEMKAIMNEEIIPVLSSESDMTIIHKTILTCCVGETSIENELEDIINTFPDNLKIAYLPALAQVRLRLTANGKDKAELQRLVDLFSHKITDKLGKIIYGFNNSSLEKELSVICIEKGISIGTAESCTGGHIANKIISVPGSSVYFKGSIVCYSNEIKIRLLHVQKETIESYGVVSEQAVIEMVDGALSALKTEVVVAVSGIAGPEGGSPEKPVGTIWLCVGNKGKKTPFLLKAGKDRNKNIEIASVYALNLLRQFILKEY